MGVEINSAGLAQTGTRGLRNTTAFIGGTAVLNSMDLGKGVNQFVLGIIAEKSATGEGRGGSGLAEGDVVAHASEKGGGGAGDQPSIIRHFIFLLVRINVDRERTSLQPCAGPEKVHNRQTNT